MDFIRSLDDDENSPRHVADGEEEYGERRGSERGDEDREFARTLAAPSLGLGLPLGAGRTRPASAALPSSSAATRPTHTPVLHRPSTLSAADFPPDPARDAEFDRVLMASSLGLAGLSMGLGLGFGAGMGGGVGATGPSAAAQALAEAARQKELESLRAAALAERAEAAARAQAASESSIRAAQSRVQSFLSSQDTGNYFRENERDEVSPSFAAGLGPGASALPAPSPLSASTLGTALAGYKTRDLFSSQARRAKESREKIVMDSLKNPVAGLHRPREPHALTTEDFPDMRRRDVGYAAGPDADKNSRAHPDVRLGLHRLRPTLDEKRVEASVAALSAAHMARRMVDQRVEQSVRARVADFAAGLERRDEETARREEEPYRLQLQRREADAAPPDVAAKMRPGSAPMPRTSAGANGTHRKRASISAAAAAAAAAAGTHPVPEEDGESIGVDGGVKHQILSPSERARRDTRKAISHADVQLLEEQAAATAALEQRGGDAPAGFSLRPSTAGANRLKAARYAGAAAAAAVASAGHAHVHSHACNGSCGSDSIGAIALQHQHKIGAAALSLYSSQPRVPAPSTVAAAAGSSTVPAMLPVPVRAIESHFQHEAWSMERRSEGEIDALAREFEATLARKERAEDGPTSGGEDGEDEESVAFEDSIAGATAARMKHELRKAERRRQRDEARMAAAEARAEQRDQLRLKTAQWGAESLGVVPLGSSAADMSLAALKGKQNALAKVGASLGKTATHDVAFNSSVVKRRENPPPKGSRVKKEEPPPPPPEPAPKRGGSRRSVAPPPPPPPPVRSSSTKKPAVSRAKPASIGPATLAKSQAIQENRDRASFLDDLLGSVSTREVGAAVAEGAVGGSRAVLGMSFSVGRDAQDEESRRAKQRPFSATAAFASGAAVPPAGSSSGSSMLRPATASLLGHGVSHPALLKNAQARASATTSVMAHVQGHVHRSEGMRLVEAVKEKISHAISHAQALGSAPGAESAAEERAALQQRLRVSRATLERALIAPHVSLTAEQQRKLLPAQLSNIAADPFALPKKKKTKKKGRKGSSKKKKSSSSGSSGSGKKKKKSSKSGSPEGEGLSFPPGTPTATLAQYTSNPLVSDLALIGLDDLAATPAEKAQLREVVLRHAPGLVLVFDLFSSRVGGGGGASSAGGAGGPALMSHIKFWQLLHVAGVFEPAAAGASSGSAPAAHAPGVSSRAAFEILVDDDDLGLESVDVDELLSRPAWLERVARVAVAKCGATKGPSAQQSSPAAALDTFISKYLLPNALSISATDLRMRLLSEPVQAALHQHNIPLQAMFSLYAAEKEGTIPAAQVRALLRDCAVQGAEEGVAGGGVDLALQQTLPHVAGADLPAQSLFFPEFVELLVRMAALAQPPEADLATSLTAFLGAAWSALCARVPAAAATAQAIAQSHSAAAAHATAAAGAGSPTAKVQFAQ